MIARRNPIKILNRGNGAPRNKGGDTPAFRLKVKERRAKAKHNAKNRKKNNTK